jgi:GxxExxY protein
VDPKLRLRPGMLIDDEDLNRLTERVIGGGITVHRVYGPGLLESIYQACFIIELRAAGLRVETERVIPVTYRGIEVARFRVDMIVEDRVIVEVKAVQALAPIHSAQVITYLKLTGCPVGLLMNFNVPVLREGVRRLVRPRSSPGELPDIAPLASS